MLPTGILISCTGHFWSSSLCWFGFCLQVSSVSNFRPEIGRGGLLFRFPCSVALWGGRGAAYRYRCVWVVLTVLRPHWVCPCSRVCALPVYTAQALGCSIWSGPCIACSSSFRVFHKSTDSVGPMFFAFPDLSSSGSQELDGRTLSWWGVPYPLCSPSLSFHAHQLGALCVCSRELASSCDPPGGCQLSRISGSLWLETGSLFAVW